MTKSKVVKLELCWTGKQAALQEAFTPCTKKLIPCPDESINFNETENMFIEGDNLDALKLLMEEYAGKVKMIYIDPPYNTGNKLCYKDNFRMKLVKGADNLERSGCLHINWLNMMYPRLYLARNLLRDDGVIFISIDDNEVHNLRNICDEIFGEENFLSILVWRKKAGGDAGTNFFYIEQEYILVYTKNISNLNKLYQSLSIEQLKEYKNLDKDPRGLWKPVDYSAPTTNNNPNQFYDIKTPSGKVYKKHWANVENKYLELVQKNMIWFGANGDSPPKRKLYLSEKEGISPRTLLYNVCLNSDGNKDFLILFENKLFDFPKPVKLINHLLDICGCNKNDLILDFFAGSSTTAHAVLDLNKQDSGNRRFIMVQLPEPCDENSEAFKAGYKTIADIGKERIRRVINKLNEDDAGKFDFGCKQDRGFKVLKIG